ncbi:ORF6N domain-containing protein [Ligilactobacillus saerimneri]|uniref:ORF6N domain-containing protein n=1 Tax=Ligilactobacillus saerimneri TaxID=228229 RepID=UPI002942684B|nr:ORF6N domain-containing protein [Ligilactobacillus saerimneri]
MNDLKVLGKEKVGQYEFTGIEGGFGEGKKAMLVKDIAAIHGTTIKRINEVINRNRKRFRNSIDLIDLKQVVQNDLFSDYGFTKAQWGNSNNIYLLSERGYAKLLKILEDDKAWEIYDELVDNYFNMRLAVKTDNKQILANKRLAIMEANAATRQANLMYKIAMGTSSKSIKERLLAKSAERMTGERFTPEATQEDYSAAEVGEMYGITAQKVGRIANELGLKADKPGQNKFGRWALSKSKYSNKEVLQWLYSKAGAEEIGKYVEGSKK